MALVVFTYLITRDIVETLERKLGYNLDTCSQEKIRLLEDNFLSEFWQYIPLEIVKKEVRAKNISEELSSIVARSDLPVVSLDRIYFPIANKYLEATRITNPNTGEVVIGERCGALSLDWQLEQLRIYRSIVLADVGSFEGTTLLKICSLLEQKGLDIEEIVLGFVGKVAQEKLGSKYKLSSVYNFEFYEWIELRDFFGIDGRRKFGSNELMPYWNNLPSWASISVSDEQSVVCLCKAYNVQLMDILVKGGYDLQKIVGRINYNGGEKNE